MMRNPATLTTGSTLTYQTLKGRLQAEDLNLDELTLADTLEGITNLHEMIAAVIRSALVDEALCAGLRLRADEMKQRLSRLDETSRQEASTCTRGDDRSWAQQTRAARLHRLSSRRHPSLVVISEDTIPPIYWLPQPPKLDRQALLGDLKRGDPVPGAQLSNPKPVLTVRTK